MASSESEDFESADEELDIELSQKTSNSNNKNKNQRVSTEKTKLPENSKHHGLQYSDNSFCDDSITRCKEGEIDNISDKLNKTVHLKNPTGTEVKLTSKTLCPEVTEVIRESSIKIEDGGIEKTSNNSNELLNSKKPEDHKVKRSSKKLGTKLTTGSEKSVLKHSGDVLEITLENKSVIARSDNSNEKKENIKENELSSKITSGYNSKEIKKRFDNFEGSSEIQKDNYSLIKTTRSVEKIEDKKINSLENFVDYGNKMTNDTPRNILETRDGWEIDEDDAFENSELLSNSCGRSIKGATDQSSNPEQVEFSLSEQNQGWPGWGGWGVSSLLSTATGTVSTFSSQVTAGLSTVLETTVGAPSPETLASSQNSGNAEPQSETKNNEGKPEQTENITSSGTGYGGFSSIVSGVSLLGNTVINRGLDTLETIGKKTMEVLQEGDPGLKKKRSMLFPNQEKPVLSQILREAKEKADHSDKEKEEKEAYRRAHFESLFDDFQGMVHLEALEMLSTQCELKLQSLILEYSGPQLLDLQETMSQVRDLCELTDEDEEIEAVTQDQFSDLINGCVKNLNIDYKPAKIIQVSNQICKRLEELSLEESSNTVNQTAISSMAELTSAGMECFHKSAELLLAKTHHNTADEAESYVQLTSHLCARISVVASDFTQLLTKKHPIANSSSITNIFLEASNSCSYIRNACQLLVPILQVGAVST